MNDDSYRDQQWHRIDAELPALLTGLQVMRHARSRRLVLQDLRRRLGHDSHPLLGLSPHLDTDQQAAAIARTCSHDALAFATVVEVLDDHEPAVGALHPVQRLLHEAIAIGESRSEDWSELRPVLQRVVPSNAGRLYQRIVPPQLSGPPTWCRTAWDVYVQLSDTNSAAGGLPPHIDFLLLLEGELDASSSRLVRDRNRRWAADCGLTEVLDRRRAAISSGAGHPDPYVYLVVLVEPLLGPESAGRYTVTDFRQWHSAGQWRCQRIGPSRDVVTAQLDLAIQGILREMEADWLTRREEVVVELVLPGELLGTVVVDPLAGRRQATADGTPLALNYPVRRRSLDRLRISDWHDDWQRRWLELRRGSASEHVYRSVPWGRDQVARLETELSDDAQVAVVVLSEPPTATSGDGMREMMTALRLGVPVVLWHASRPTDDEVWEEVRRMATSGRIGGLPIHVRKSRIAEPVAATGPSEQEIAVLWDDPDRVPLPVNAIRTSGAV